MPSADLDLPDVPLSRMSQTDFDKITADIRESYAATGDGLDFKAAYFARLEGFDAYLAEHARRAAQPTDKQLEAIAKMLFLASVEDKAWGEMAWAEMTMPDDWSQEAFELAEQVREAWFAAGAGA